MTECPEISPEIVDELCGLSDDTVQSLGGGTMPFGLTLPEFNVVAELGADKVAEAGPPGMTLELVVVTFARGDELAAADVDIPSTAKAAAKTANRAYNFSKKSNSLLYLITMIITAYGLLC